MTITWDRLQMPLFQLPRTSLKINKSNIPFLIKEMQRRWSGKARMKPVSISRAAPFTWLTLYGIFHFVQAGEPWDERIWHHVMGIKCKENCLTIQTAVSWSLRAKIMAQLWEQWPHICFHFGVHCSDNSWHKKLHACLSLMSAEPRVEPQELNPFRESLLGCD